MPGVGNSLPLSNCEKIIEAANARSDGATNIGEDATANDYLRSARASLVSGLTCQAQQSLDMAETRALDRSVVQSQKGVPDDGQLVSRIRDVRHALDAGDNAHAIQLVDLALSS